MDESYPDNFAKLELMVSPEGEAFMIGGDREEGEGDMPYIGWERMRKKTQAEMKEKDRQIERLEKALEEVNKQITSLRPLFPCPECGTIIRQKIRGKCAYCATLG